MSNSLSKPEDQSTNSRDVTLTDLNRAVCDNALSVFSALSKKEWRGRRPFAGGEIVFPDHVLAREYAAAGQHALKVHGDHHGAIRLLDTSIRLEYAAALEASDNLVLRVEAYHALGEERPARAILLYNLAVSFCHHNRWREAVTAYRAAADLDPLFSWHANNIAWLAATSTIPEALNGLVAVAYATQNCIWSSFSCWAFLGTLAAAYARSGDYDRAVRWQRIATKLSPEAERPYSEARIAIYESGRAFIDIAPRPIGGVNPEGADEATFQAQWKEALALMGAPPETVH